MAWKPTRSTSYSGTYICSILVLQNLNKKKLVSVLDLPIASVSCKKKKSVSSKRMQALGMRMILLKEYDTYLPLTTICCRQCIHTKQITFQLSNELFLFSYCMYSLFVLSVEVLVSCCWLKTNNYILTAQTGFLTVVTPLNYHGTPVLLNYSTFILYYRVHVCTYQLIQNFPLSNLCFQIVILKIQTC
jgi:hypothetical protein